MSGNTQVEDIESLRARLATLEAENKTLKTEKSGEVFNQLDQPNANTIAKQMIEDILGKRFKWRIAGFGKDSVLELIIPEDMADPSTGFEQHKVETTNKATGEVTITDGRSRFRKPHPRAGEVCGDPRTCRISTEEQIKKWLELVKKNILTRFQAEGKNLPEFK